MLVESNRCYQSKCTYRLRTPKKHGCDHVRSTTESDSFSYCLGAINKFFSQLILFSSNCFKHDIIDFGTLVILISICRYLVIRYLVITELVFVIFSVNYYHALVIRFSYDIKQFLSGFPSGYSQPLWRP